MEKDGSFTVHDCNNQILAIEMFQVYNNLPEPTFNDVFIRQENMYNFRRNRVSNTNWKSSSVGISTLSCLIVGGGGQIKYTRGGYQDILNKRGGIFWSFSYSN